MITLNESIGILQRTYTRAINLQNNWSGSLFRSDCKAKTDGRMDVLHSMILERKIIGLSKVIVMPIPV